MPLWFVGERQTEKIYTWKDIEGYTYKSCYKLPDGVDALILLYLLNYSQKNDWTNELVLTRYKILKGCDISCSKTYYKRLMEGLARWEGISIKFAASTFKGVEDEDGFIPRIFGIIDAVNEHPDTKALKIRLSKEWLLRIKESNFCKYINFDYYKALRRPVTRRLHEILCKSFYKREKFSIGLVKLGTKLTLSKDRVRNKKGEVCFHPSGEPVRKIYVSAVLTKIKPALNEIKKLAKDAKACKEIGVKAKDRIYYDYSIFGKGQDRVIIFTQTYVTDEAKTAQAEKNKPQPTPEPASQKKTETEKTPEVNQLELFGEDTGPGPKRAAGSLADLVELVKSNKIYGTMRNALEKALAEHGHDYCRWNILYTNKEAKKGPRAYSTFLQRALAGNWASDYREEKEQVQEQISREQEIRALIDSKGGVENVRYGGGRIQLCEAGLINQERNSVTPWAWVETETIHALEDIPEEYR